MKKIKNPWLHEPGYNCICCGPENPVGLHLEFWEDGEDVLTKWTPTQNYQGWIDTLHGGIQSMLLDEVAGWVVTRKLQTTGVTSSQFPHATKNLSSALASHARCATWPSSKAKSIIVTEKSALKPHWYTSALPNRKQKKWDSADAN